MYKKYTSGKGLKVVVSPMPHMSSITLGVWIGVGGRYEKASQMGISHLVEHMLFKGTLRRTARDLKEAIEGVGGAFNGFTSDEVTCYMVKVPAGYLELGMDILTDMVLNASFDRKDLAREKFVVCEEIKMYRDQPSDHVLDMLGEIMWPGHPLGRPLTGNIGTVKALTRDELVRFRDSNYHPGNIAVIAAGNVSPERVKKEAYKAFSGRERKGKKTFKTPSTGKGSPRIRVSRGKTQQAHVAMGFYAPDMGTRDRFSTKLMNIILGGNMSSRLFEELREKQGMCYDISSAYKVHRDIGEIQVHAGVDIRKTAGSILSIIKEVRAMRDEGVTREELDRAKKYAKGQFLLAMERTSTRMLWLGDRLMVHGVIPDQKEVLRNIDSVTPSSVRNMAKKIFRSSNMNLAMIGKISPVEKKVISRELREI